MNIGRILLLFIVVLSFLHCDNDNVKPLDGSYPKGFSVVNMNAINDCLLPECSPERVVRLNAKNAIGTIVKDLNGEYAINYTFTFDSFLLFYLCDLSEAFKINGLMVRFDGKAIDACGYREAIWPTEEVYTLTLTKINKI